MRTHTPTRLTQRLSRRKSRLFRITSPLPVRICGLGATLLTILALSVGPASAASSVRLDVTFSGDGLRTFEFGQVDDVHAVFVDASGRLTLGGTTWPNDERIILIRLTAGGRLDRTL